MNLPLFILILFFQDHRIRCPGSLEEQALAGDPESDPSVILMDTESMGGPSRLIPEPLF